MTIETLSGALMPSALLLPFHDVRLIRWDALAGKGRIETVRRNRLDDWYYSCHFLGDPVMPGCWGVDAVWQSLRHFAAWRGLPPCRPVGMEDVRFFGQIRPHDKEIVYAVDVERIEESDGDWLLTGRGSVLVDGTPVYSIGEAQVGTAFWSGGPPVQAPPARDDDRPSSRLHYDEFLARRSFSRAEIVALAQGTLVAEAPPELGLLPTGPMLEVGRVDELVFDEAAGTGRIVAVKTNDPHDWHYPMNGGTKPAALSLDGVWQLLGLCLSWRGQLGTGRALGFERLELFDEIGPADRELLTVVDISRISRSPQTGDAFVLAGARVYADGRPILSCVNASVGCHRGIRYADYPHESVMAHGGKVRKNLEARP